MMLNGDDGSVMIDGTEVSPRINNGGQEIHIDSQDKAHIVWHQEVWNYYTPESCTVGGLSVLDQVTGLDDGQEADITGTALEATWTDIPPSQTSHTLLIKPRSGTDYEFYDIEVWDGMDWRGVPPPGYPANPFHAGPAGWMFNYNLDPHLTNGAVPGDNGDIKIRINHPSPGTGLFIDFIGFYQGDYAFPSVEVFYTKLDPEKADKDGEPADESLITMVPDKMLSELEGINSMWPTIAIDQMDRVHVPWFELANWGSFPYDVVFAIHDDEGVRLTPIIPITPPGDTYAGSYQYGWMIYPSFPYIDTDYYDGAHITWCDVRELFMSGSQTYGHNIYHAYMNPDLDMDGLGLEGEIQAGTDPTDPDSDNDGLRDGAELELGTDPLVKDTDGDGTPDGADPAPTDPTISAVEEEEEEAPIEIDLDIDMDGGPSAYGRGRRPVSTLEAAKPEEKAEEVEFTSLDWFLILFIIALAVTLVSTLQYQKRKMEGLIKARCVSGQQTRLLDMPDQMKEAVDIKKAKRIRPGNPVEILDVKGNMVEIATEIGSFFVPADFLSCAEGLEEMETGERKRRTAEEAKKRKEKSD
jgi:hypothetical protein